MTQVWSLSIDEFLEIAKALSNETRVEIFKRIQSSKSLNVNEIAAIFDLPSSTATVNIKKLEEAGLIKTEIVPGTRGTQKLCSPRYERLVVDLSARREPDAGREAVIEMPIGAFADIEARPTCGMVSPQGIIGYLDDPRSFYEPGKLQAGLLWLSQGYVEYRFPNKVPYHCRLTTLEISAELCSEAPGYHLNCPSEITLWVNGVEVGTWLSPGDFGGERGLLTPEWWGVGNTQYGLLKRWRITDQGSFVDGQPVSEVTTSDLRIGVETNGFSVRLGVKADAVNSGGFNLFGRSFGNYEQDLVVTQRFEVQS